MSSPLARKDNQIGFAHKIIISLHRKLSHSIRKNILSNKLIGYFNDLVVGKENINCLDVGCGDLGIMERIAESVHGTNWHCIDIHDLPEHFVNNPKWSSYKKFNGKDLPFSDDSMDIILFCDVLHHANKNAIRLLKEAHRVGKIVIIKDSFEYSIYSRWMLKIMDIIGNWGYGVSIPEKYFSIYDFKRICNQINFNINILDIGIHIYDHLPVIRSILRPEWHFIAVLEKD